MTDQDEIELDFVHSRVWDHSGMEAIVDLARRYDRVGKSLTLSHLNKNCQRMLSKADLITWSQGEDDQSFRIIVSGLGGSNNQH